MLKRFIGTSYSFLYILLYNYIAHHGDARYVPYSTKKPYSPMLILLKDRIPLIQSDYKQDV